MRRRSTIGWLLAATLAGALAGVVLGIGATRYQVRLLRAELARLEQSRVQLRENSEQLAEALREARTPLARRIHELETSLAARESAPDSEDPGEPPAIADAAEHEPSNEPIQLAATALPAQEVATSESVAPLEVESPAATAPAGPAEEPATEEAAPSPEAKRSKASAPPPAVSAPPPAALPATPADPDSPCRSLAEPDFALGSPGAEIRRFEGRLLLSVDASGPALVLRLGDDTRHTLAELPLHVATLCEGLAYIVSVCVAERDPFEVRGVISPADAWHKPCREILRARARANP